MIRAASSGGATSPEATASRPNRLLKPVTTPVSATIAGSSPVVSLRSTTGYQLASLQLAKDGSTGEGTVRPGDGAKKQSTWKGNWRLEDWRLEADDEPVGDVGRLTRRVTVEFVTTHSLSMSMPVHQWFHLRFQDQTKPRADDPGGITSGSRWLSASTRSDPNTPGTTHPGGMPPSACRSTPSTSLKCSRLDNASNFSILTSS